MKVVVLRNNLHFVKDVPIINLNFILSVFIVYEKKV